MVCKSAGEVFSNMIVERPNAGGTLTESLVQTMKRQLLGLAMRVAREFPSSRKTCRTVVSKLGHYQENHV